jgi:hypothetical protein
MWHMGAVKGQRLVKKELLTPCDARCTNAEGPHCDCQCLGANHGSRALVQVVKDVGGVPLVAPSDAAASERRHEFLEAKDEALHRIEKQVGKGVLKDFELGKWIDNRDTWEKVNTVTNEYRAAIRLKSQRGRMKALGKIAAPRLSR